MEIIKELLPGAFLLEYPRFDDDRGYLSIPFNRGGFARNLFFPFRVDQVMYSVSYLNVLRGLHYQDRSAPVGKFIYCTDGIVYDVLVDLRSKSKTFGQWVGIELIGSDNNVVLAPVGVAHGFLSLRYRSKVFYHQSGGYEPSAYHTLAWDDPDLAIDWPIKGKPILSEQDQNGISWQEYKRNPAF